MKRRESLIALVTLATARMVIPAHAQERVWRVGFLTQRRRPDSIEAHFIGGFPRGMRELGYVEGRNLVIEWRFDENPDRLPELASELARLNVDAIVSGSSQAIQALRKATSTIPIVMATSGDPVGSGFVRTLARPGGIITGLSNLTSDIGTKQLELLQAVNPKLNRVAILVNPDNPSLATFVRNVQSTAERGRLKLVQIEARNALEIDRAFPAMAEARAGALIVATDALLIQHYPRIADLAMRNRLPAVSQIREFVEAGGLVSYGPNLTEQFRRAATYVDKIFKGAKPGDLPVEQSASFELLVNGRTAKSLGIAIPRSLLLRADRVIE